MSLENSCRFPTCHAFAHVVAYWIVMVVTVWFLPGHVVSLQLTYVVGFYEARKRNIIQR